MWGQNYAQIPQQLSGTEPIKKQTMWNSFKNEIYMVCFFNQKSIIPKRTCRLSSLPSREWDFFPLNDPLPPWEIVRQIKYDT